MPCAYDNGKGGRRRGHSARRRHFIGLPQPFFREISEIFPYQIQANSHTVVVNKRPEQSMFSKIDNVSTNMRANGKGTALKRAALAAAACAALWAQGALADNLSFNWFTYPSS